MNKKSNVISLKKIRKKLKAKKLLTVIRVVIVILAVLAAAFLSVRLLGKVAVSNTTDAVRAIPSMFSSSGKYPYALDSLTFRRADLIGNDILLLTSDNAKVISSAPRERLNYQLGSADVKAVTSNGRALLFSNTNGNVTMLGKTEKLGSVTVPSTVSTADLASNGSFALTYSSDKVQSVVEIYNSRFKKVFQWNCSKEFVSSLSLSDNGKSVALAAVGSRNAEIYSRLIIFGIKNTEPTVDINLNGTMLLKVIFTSAGKIIAVGDNKTLVYDRKGSQLSEKTYPETSLATVDCDDSGNTVICCREYGGAKYEILRISSSGKITCDFTADYTPEMLSVKGSRFAVSSGSNVRIYSSKGEEVKTVETASAVSRLFLSSNNIYTVEGSSICKY